jgi:hypothetical protein
MIHGFAALDMKHFFNMDNYFRNVGIGRDAAYAACSC